MQGRGFGISQGRGRRLVLLTLGLAVAFPTIASGHLERPSYWPDPTPDTSISPPAGGKVPKARSLASAVTGKGPGDVRIVCKRNSLKLALKSIAKAKNRGFRLRPSQPKRKLSRAKAAKLVRWNRVFSKKCGFRSVQKAVKRSRNNDRVVIMPGRYTEPKSRKAPVNDPKCNPDFIQEDQSGNDTPSYKYQVKCPNDQNLIHVAGRALKGDPLPEPRADRHGIPEQELGRCLRCNLQIEGSGARPEDVILDAGANYKNPKRPAARPGGDRPSSECRSNDNDNPCFGKHVVLRTDRSDGFVGRNFLMRGAKEHGFYTEETDGILLDRVKFFWNRDYGHLSFTTDHHVVKNCDGFGSGDAVVYPGAAPQTGEFRNEEFYPDSRYNTTIKRCDLRGSAMGYSGSMGNSVRVTRNHFYGNANGLTTDTLSSPGHPGFPADGMKIDRNWFYANNLDVYRDDPPFDPLVPQPVGTGFFWAGNNNGRFVKNWVFDNWRQGTMLIAIPDALAGEVEGEADREIHCPTAGGLATSCENRYIGNRMGQVPPGFRPHPGLKKFGNKTTLAGRTASETAPNGVDFWWDEATPNIGNCWADNTGPDGKRDSLKASPQLAPVAGQNLPLFLPENCNGLSTGSPAYAAKAAYLISCFLEYQEDEMGTTGCDWWDTPPQPSSRAGQARNREQQRLLERLGKSESSDTIDDWMSELAGDIYLGPSH